MAVVIYKGGERCLCPPERLQALLKAGYSVKPDGQKTELEKPKRGRKPNAFKSED